jgi:hypothetical protein
MNQIRETVLSAVRRMYGRADRRQSRNCATVQLSVVRVIFMPRSGVLDRSCALRARFHGPTARYNFICQRRQRTASHSQTVRPSSVHRGSLSSVGRLTGPHQCKHAPGTVPIAFSAERRQGCELRAQAVLSSAFFCCLASCASEKHVASFFRVDNKHSKKAASQSMC